jgi:hypothetical protein
MKNKLIATSLIATSLIAALSFSQSIFADQAAQADIDASHKIVKQFMGKLKGELMGAMKAGGPINALQVCNIKALVITQNVSAEHKMDIGRTSLKLRNPINTPDSWEAKVLHDFEKRKAAGEAVKPMEYAELVDNNGTKQFRYMKAIPVAKPCLNCHGEEVKAGVLNKISALYPSDKAIGYKLGDIRGAFTITKNIK